MLPLEAFITNVNIRKYGRGRIVNRFNFGLTGFWPAVERVCRIACALCGRHIFSFERSNQCIGVRPSGLWPDDRYRLAGRVGDALRNVITAGTLLQYAHVYSRFGGWLGRSPRNEGFEGS